MRVVKNNCASEEEITAAQNVEIRFEHIISRFESDDLIQRRDVNHTIMSIRVVLRRYMDCIVTAIFMHVSYYTMDLSCSLRHLDCTPHSTMTRNAHTKEIRHYNHILYYKIALSIPP